VSAFPDRLIFGPGLPPVAQEPASSNTVAMSPSKIDQFRSRHPSLPAGAVAGWGLHPLEKQRLVTAHVEKPTFAEATVNREVAPIPVFPHLRRNGGGRHEAPRDTDRP
jgi:hypothetical protein